MLNRKKPFWTIADMDSIVSKVCFLILIQNTISKNMDIQKKTIGMQLPRSLFPSNMSLSAQVELAKNWYQMNSQNKESINQFYR